MSNIQTSSGDSCSFAFSLWIIMAQVIYSFMLGFWTMYHRKKNVSGDVLKKQLGEEHKKHNLTPAMLAYPDMGSGKYACALPYDNWYNWNCAMRAHQDAAELVVPAVMATLGNLYFCPCSAAFFGTLILITRVLHTFACMKVPAMVNTASNLNKIAIGCSLALTLFRTF